VCVRVYICVYVFGCACVCAWVYINTQAGQMDLEHYRYEHAITILSAALMTAAQIQTHEQEAPPTPAIAGGGIPMKEGAVLAQDVRLLLGRNSQKSARDEIYYMKYL